MLELDDIQHILLTRTPALTGRYVFVSFADADSGRAWLKELLPTVRSAAAVGVGEADRSWVTLAFTWAGLERLGVGPQSLDSFPDAFRQGMAARAEVLGDTGRERPRTLGRRHEPAGPSRHRHPVRPQRRGAAALRSASTSFCWGAARASA